MNPFDYMGYLGLIVFLATFFAGSSANAERTLIDKLEEKYFSVLDEWVDRGGKVNEFQGVVVQTCEKLVLATASPSEMVALSTNRIENFVFRVNVCTKTTVNRVYHQSEFDDLEIIKAICDDDEVILLKKLCSRSGLR